jgi:long-chain acyl-CoA synthetase
VFVDETNDTDNVGEICVSGPTLMCGYWKSGIGFAPVERSFFRTGDLGSVRSNGLVTINGRRDDVFKVGAEKVDRLSIEQALQEVLAGFDFCVLPVIHNVLGQTPVLFIASKGSEGLPSRNSLIRAVRSKLPPRFTPSLMLSTGGALPKLPNGKLDKQLLINSFSKFSDAYAK